MTNSTYSRVGDHGLASLTQVHSCVSPTEVKLTVPGRIPPFSFLLYPAKQDDKTYPVRVLQHRNPGSLSKNSGSWVTAYPGEHNLRVIYPLQRSREPFGRSPPSSVQRTSTLPVMRFVSLQCTIDTGWDAESIDADASMDAVSSGYSNNNMCTVLRQKIDLFFG